MSDLPTLIQQQQALQHQIATQKMVAVAEVVATMERLGLTWADFGVAPVSPVKPAAKRKIKYRDDRGNTWTGVGQRPRWLVSALEAGADMEQFRVREGG
jgi:DNA-binding protein H-NS